MPPNEALLREPIDHPHANIVIKDKDACAALVYCGYNDKIIHKRIHLNFIQR
jgi:hypothetical protein